MAVLAELSRGAAASRLETGEVIGEGGMGVIRAATQVALGRGVAVKTLRPARRQPAAALELLREAWLTGTLEHPNVVPVHYLEIDSEGVPLIVMKRITGVEWSKLLGDAAEVERRFGATDLLAWNLGILLQVLNAVRYAHSRGVIHRDLKPSNVMIGDFGEVYLLDWGIAVSMHDDGSGRLPLAANATELAGTPHYMAPEMLGTTGSAPISERTDVYLCGAVLHELITGRPPHEGRTAIAVFASVAASTPSLPATVPPELARICLRALHAHPDERFASADALRVALQSYLAHRGSSDLVVRARVRLAELTALLASAPATELDVDPAEDAAHREAIYRLFGACRFGFHEALAVWPENEDAQHGLMAAVTSVAEYELTSGNPAGALTLLGELASAPAELVARARAEVEQAALHRAELEKLHAQHDAKLGRRTRTMLAAVLGLSFTVLPLVNEFSPKLVAASSHGRNMLIALAALAVLGGIAFWSRASMLATSFNRRIMATGLFVFVFQVLWSAGAWELGISVVQAQVAMLFLWGVVTASIAINLDLWLWPSALGFFVAFLVAANAPELRFYAMSAANLGFTINAIVRWAPETLRQTEEERRAQLARDLRHRLRLRRRR